MLRLAHLTIAVSAIALSASGHRASANDAQHGAAGVQAMPPASISAYEAWALLRRCADLEQSLAPTLQRARGARPSQGPVQSLEQRVEMTRTLATIRRALAQLQADIEDLHDAIDEIQDDIDTVLRQIAALESLFRGPPPRGDSDFEQLVKAHKKLLSFGLRGGNQDSRETWLAAKATRDRQVDALNEMLEALRAQLNELLDALGRLEALRDFLAGEAEEIQVALQD